MATEDAYPRSADGEDLNDRQAPSGRRRPYGVAGPLLVAVVLVVATGMFLYRYNENAFDAAFVGDCAAIDDDTVRLDCYDQSRHRPQRQPARGAAIPQFDSN